MTVKVDVYFYDGQYSARLLVKQARLLSSPDSHIYVCVDDCLISDQHLSLTTILLDFAWPTVVLSTQPFSSVIISVWCAINVRKSIRRASWTHVCNGHCADRTSNMSQNAHCVHVLRTRLTLSLCLNWRWSGLEKSVFGRKWKAMRNGMECPWAIRFTIWKLNCIRIGCWEWLRVYMCDAMILHVTFPAHYWRIPVPHADTQTHTRLPLSWEGPTIWLQNLIRCYPMKHCA